MLVLTRKLNEEILVGENIKITLLRVRGNTVRIGIEAPREIRVTRGELSRRVEGKADKDQIEEFEITDREQPFAHPQQSVAVATSGEMPARLDTPGSDSPQRDENAGNVSQVMEGATAFSAVTATRATVSPAQRIANGASLRRAPLSQFISAT